MSNAGHYRQRLSALAANWRALALRGLAALIFGLVILAVLVGSDVQALAPFIGVFAIVVGLALIVFAFRTRDRQRHRQA
jgi:uncharacterized membrane protein HdeD (DUF308 family)